MGGRGIGKKKKARATVFSLMWMDKTIDGELNRTWLKADPSSSSRARDLTVKDV